MTKAQLDALQSYIVSVVRIMEKQGDHGHNVRLMLDSRHRLEAAFGQQLPDRYPDLLSLDTPSPFPSLL